MLCFVHVPKAGGTTVNYIFRQSIGRGYMELEPWMDEQRIVSPADLQMLCRWAPWIKHVGGHHLRTYSGLERFAPEIRYLTWLRDPVRRYLSDYYHLRHKNGRVANFYDYLKNRAWANKQTKYIAGTADAEAAKQLLAEKFSFVGLVEKMDESVVILRKVFADLELNVRYGHARNTVIDGPGHEEVKKHWGVFESYVMENNSSDLEVYRFARYELFPQQMARYGDSLEEDVTRLKVQNCPPRGRQWSYFLGRAYYRLLLKMYRRYGRKRWPIDNGRLSEEYDFFGEYVF